MATVLLVDDDPDLREMYALALERGGYRTEQAANGREALTKLRELKAPPSLVLLDLMMPEMGGAEFLDAIVGSPFAAMPIVMISGSTPSSASREKVQELVRKPASEETLLRLVAEYCGRP